MDTEAKIKALLRVRNTYNERAILAIERDLRDKEPFLCSAERRALKSIEDTRVRWARLDRKKAARRTW
jgi:hypothetical protein